MLFTALISTFLNSSRAWLSSSIPSREITTFSTNLIPISVILTKNPALLLTKYEKTS